MVWLRFPRTLALAAAGYLLAMAVVFALLSAQGSVFTRQAQQTTGTVVALVPRAPLGSTRESRSSLGPPSLAPRVSYTVDGKTYSYIAPHGRYRQRLRVGDTITVLYAATDPKRARLSDRGQPLGPVLAAGFALGALGVGLILIRTRPSRAGNDRRRGRTPTASKSRSGRPAS